MNSSKSSHLTEAVIAIFRTHGRLLDWGDNFTAPFGLTSARWQMLGALVLSGQPLTAPQIAASMGVSRQAAQKQLNLLATGDLLTKKPNPQHKRSPHYELTSKGAAVYAALERQWNDHAEKLSRELELNDLLALKRTLAVLYETHATVPEGNPQ